MTPEDLARTHRAAFAHDRPWSAEEFAALLAAPGVILCGDAKSFVLGRVVLDEAEVLTVATDPQYQRRGLGRAAFLAFESEVISKGVTRIFLEVAANNTPAKALYFKAGFEMIAERRGYYRQENGPAISAQILQKRL